MAFSAGKTLKGISVDSKISEHFIVNMVGDPGVTYTRGTMVVRDSNAGTYGCAIKASDSSALVIGRVAKTVVCPAATVPFPIPGQPPGDLDGNVAKTLIPVEVSRFTGQNLLKGHFYANAKDETVVTYSSTYHSVELTTGLGTDSYGAGALVYVYEGPCKGECNIIEDYDHAGHASGKALVAVMHRAFNGTPTSATKMLIFCNDGAAGDGIPPIGGLMDLDESSASQSDFDCADGYDDGNYITLTDWNRLADLMPDGAILAVQNLASP